MIKPEPAHEYDGAWRADRDREGAEPFEPETGEVLDEDDEGELNAEADGKIVALHLQNRYAQWDQPDVLVTVGLITFTAPCQIALGLGTQGGC